MDRYDIQAHSIAKKAERNANGAKRIENATLQAVNAATGIINSFNEHIAKQKSNEYIRNFEGDFNKKVADGYFAMDVNENGDMEYLTYEESEAKYDKWVTDYQNEHNKPKNILAKNTIEEYLKSVRNDNIGKTAVSSIENGNKIQGQLEGQFLQEITGKDLDSGDIQQHMNDVLLDFPELTDPTDPGSKLETFKEGLVAEKTSTSIKMLDYMKYLKNNTNFKWSEIKTKVEASRSLFAEQDFVHRFSIGYIYNVNDPNDSAFWEDVDKALSSDNVAFYGRALTSDEKAALRGAIAQNVAASKSSQAKEAEDKWNSFIADVASYENAGGFLTQSYVDKAFENLGINPDTDIPTQNMTKIDNIIYQNQIAMNIRSCGYEIQRILNNGGSAENRTNQIISLLDKQPYSVRNVIENNLKAISVGDNGYYVPFSEMSMNERSELAGNDYKFSLSGTFSFEDLKEPTTSSSQMFGYATLEAQINLYGKTQEIGDELRNKIDSVREELNNANPGSGDELSDNDIIYQIQTDITGVKDTAFSEKTISRELYGEWVSNYTDAASRNTKAAEIQRSEYEEKEMKGIAQLDAEISIYHKDEAHIVLPTLQAEIDKLREEDSTISTEDAVRIITEGKVIEYKDRAINKNKSVTSEAYNDSVEAAVNHYNTIKDNYLNDTVVQQQIIGLAMLGIPEAVSTGTLTQSVANARMLWEASLTDDEMAELAKNATKLESASSDKAAVSFGEGVGEKSNISREVVDTVAIDKAKDEAFEKYMYDNISQATEIIDNYGEYGLKNGDTLNSQMDTLMKEEAHSKAQENSTYYVPDSEPNSTNNIKAKNLFYDFVRQAAECETQDDLNALSIAISSSKKLLYEEDYKFLASIAQGDLLEAAESKGINVEKAITDGLGTLGGANLALSDTSIISEIRPIILSECSKYIMSTSLGPAEVAEKITETTKKWYTEYKITESLNMADDEWDKLAKSDDIGTYIFKEDYEKHWFRSDEKQRPQAADRFFNRTQNLTVTEGVTSLFGDPEVLQSIKGIINGISDGTLKDTDVNGLICNLVLGDISISGSKEGSASSGYDPKSPDSNKEAYWGNIYRYMDKELNSTQRNILGDILNTTKGIITGISKMKKEFPDLQYKSIELGKNSVIIDGNAFSFNKDGFVYITPEGKEVNMNHVSASALNNKAVELTSVASNKILDEIYTEVSNPSVVNIANKSRELRNDEFYTSLDTELEYYMVTNLGEGFNEAVDVYEALTGTELVVKSSKGRNSTVNVKLYFK